MSGWEIAWDSVATLGWVVISWKLLKAVIGYYEGSDKWFYGFCVVYLFVMSVPRIWL